MKNVIVPTPCKEKVKKYLSLWDGQEKYVAQEKALDKLFLVIFSAMII